jgi:NAD(P)-dependent dehydrogenase (short-subunit alcohol dehydrogenase family)
VGLQVWESQQVNSWQKKVLWNVQKKPIVRINSIHPDFIDAPMVASAIQPRGPEFKDYIENNIPMGILGEPLDIAEGVVYLASEAAKFVTGTELVMDGSFLAR